MRGLNRFLPKLRSTPERDGIGLAVLLLALGVLNQFAPVAATLAVCAIAIIMGAVLPLAKASRGCSG